MTPEKFWSHVVMSNPSQCWEWNAYRQRSGYGVVKWNGKAKLAHRIALSLTDGIWESPLHVCHTCDNPPCCNPAHLWRGTDRDNHNDMVSKGRRASFRGEAGGLAKLTGSQVLDIRNSSESSRRLAKRLNVSFGTVCRARTGKTWRHIP